MNQRGGGNFAKAAAEVAGFVNATGSDVEASVQDQLMQCFMQLPW